MSSESAISTAVQELETVTTEISRLRDAVAGHRDAAGRLDAVAASLGQLTDQLKLLPGSVLESFSGVSQLVSNLDASLQPAGSLERSIRELALANAQLLQEMREEREMFKAQLLSVQEESGALREAIKEMRSDWVELSESIQYSISTSGQSIQGRLQQASDTLSNAVESMHSDLRGVSSVADNCASTLAVVSGAHKNFADDYAEDVNAIKGRLAKLTGLARRGFFAQLFGKDASPDPL